MTAQHRRTALEIVLVLALAGVVFLYADVRSRIHLPSQQKPVETIYTHVPTIVGGEKLFGLQNIHGPVHSAYLYEASLIGTNPVDDIDYLTPYASNELVTLPGFTTDTYMFRYTTYIPGSGTISCWAITANSGRFCFLHLSVSNVGAPGLAPQSLFPPQPLWTKRRELSGDELTALAVLAERPIDAPMLRASRFTGGFAVGRTGWPTSPVYGNGLAGPSNSQLCLLLDQRAANWFESILNGSHKRPPPAFHQKVWDAYLAPRHKKLISAYHKGRLTRAAQAWRKHQTTYRGIASKHYYGKTATRHDAYTLWRFRCGRIYIWAKAIKLQKAACLK